MSPLKINHHTLTSALGRGTAAQWDGLQAEQSGLRECDFDTAELPAWIGRVEGLEDEPLTDEWAERDCRNNRLARIGLEQDGFIDAVKDAAERHGAERIGVFLGTSTSGIHQTELAYRNRDAESDELPQEFSYRYSQNCYSVGDFVRSYLGLAGPASVISTACSSSAKVFATAYRYIQSGFCDAAVVGGVDSLCLTTLYGFSALQLVSPQPCRPADAERDGISIGEAAGFALVEPMGKDECEFALLGYGESGDAYHMSSPDPEGAGAALAMQRALDGADIEPRAIDYVNLHGTATPANDLTEGIAVARVVGEDTPCSSTKGWIGHCLGAAGIAEAVFSLLCIQHGHLPRSLNTRTVDPAVRGRVLMQSESAPVAAVLSNSFGFGGNNCSLLLGRPR